jgi:phenylacetate-CoA ligase
MGTYRWVAQHLLAPALDAIRGAHAMSCLRELEESQWWPQERIEELQSERLRGLVSHAYARVPYYRRIMDERGIRPGDIRSAADLRKLPVLTRELVRTNFDNLVAEGFPRRQIRTGTTGGSTGAPLLFYTTDEDRRSHGFARAMRAVGFAGQRLGDRRMLIRAARRHPSRRDRVLHRISRHLERVHEVDSLDLGLDSLPGIVATLRRRDMTCLAGYPSAIAFIASWICGSGVAHPELGSVITSGEQLFEYQRQRIRAAFNVEPYSEYSCYEAFDIAMECEAHAGLHVAAEDIVAEVVDTAGTALPPGQEGRILLTNLHNYAMPLIRYENGDAVSLVDGACPCGRSLPRLSHVVGRRTDILHTPSGLRITGTNLPGARMALFPVLQYQNVQEDLDRLVVHIVPWPGTTEEGLEDMRRRIPPMYNKVVGDDVHIEIRFCERIEPSPSGKLMALISKVDPDSWLKTGDADLSSRRASAASPSTVLIRGGCPHVIRVEEWKAVRDRTVDLAGAPTRATL